MHKYRLFNHINCTRELSLFRQTMKTIKVKEHPFFLLESLKDTFIYIYIYHLNSVLFRVNIFFIKIYALGRSIVVVDTDFSGIMAWVDLQNSDDVFNISRVVK